MTRTAFPFICMQTEKSDVRDYRRGIRYQRKKPENIQEVDEKRTAFQEQCTSTRWGDGNEYDLCIDTGKIGIENAVEMILEYIRFENIF